MKSCRHPSIVLRRLVAPHWGAWIEITTWRVPYSSDSMSHPTGVRGLKSVRAPACFARRLSHPTGVRGLKSPVEHQRQPLVRVAPHWGAWIEIPTTGASPWRRPQSHPTGVRGLKSNVIREEERRRWVAPHWGAWIEITHTSISAGICNVAPHWGAWIEISQSLTRCAGMSCRTPLGCVD